MAHDIAVLCALRTPELEKVLATGQQPWDKLRGEAGDPTAYRATTFATPAGRSLSVVAAAPSQMGMSAAAALAAYIPRATLEHCTGARLEVEGPHATCMHLRVGCGRGSRLRYHGRSLCHDVCPLGGRRWR